MFKLNARTNMATFSSRRYSEFLKNLYENKFRYSLEEKNMIVFKKYNEQKDMIETFIVMVFKDTFYVHYIEDIGVTHGRLTDKLNRAEIEKCKKINIALLLGLYPKMAL